nr:SNARE-associated protein Snapin [Vulpes vulpes]
MWDSLNLGDPVLSQKLSLNWSVGINLSGARHPPHPYPMPKKIWRTRSPAPPAETRFPGSPQATSSRQLPGAPRRRTSAQLQFPAARAAVPGGRAARDGGGWFRRSVWGAVGLAGRRAWWRRLPALGETLGSGLSSVGLVPLHRESQVELREQIDNLATELCRINEDQKVALDLDPYVKKLLNARRRVVLVNNILQNAQERLRRLNHSVAKETARRRAMLDSGLYPPGSPSK